MFNPRSTTPTAPQAVDYKIPEGCPVCDADLPVRVTPRGPRGVCVSCGWMGKPILTVVHNALRVECEAAQA